MTKQERIEELTKVIQKAYMENFCRSQALARPEQIAKALYDAGYRKINCGENKVLDDAVNEAVDTAFRGAVLRLAEKLKQRSYCDNCFKDGKWHRYVFIEDIDATAKKFLESET